MSGIYFNIVLCTDGSYGFSRIPGDKKFESGYDEVAQILGDFYPEIKKAGAVKIESEDNGNSNFRKISDLDETVIPKIRSDYKNVEVKRYDGDA